MNAPAQSVYNLNLSPRYAQNWGAWEIAREICCNAIDADPDGYRASSDAPDCLTVTTETVPELSQMFVIGDGVKSIGGDTIGQFGEGMKMAALAATRMNPTNGLVLETPTHRVTFKFQSAIGTDTLHAVVEEGHYYDGLRATINVLGVDTAYKGRIIPGMEHGPHPLGHQSQPKLFVKGVYICDLPGKWLWSWNLPNVEVNRDRALASTWNISYAAATWMLNRITPDMVCALIGDSDANESKCLQYRSSPHLYKTIIQEFRRVHGDTAILADGSEYDTKAKARGFSVIVVTQPEFRDVIHNAGVKYSREVCHISTLLEPVSPDPYKSAISRLRTLDDLIAAPPVTIRVFANRQDSLKGLAAPDDNVIWLSEGLFTDGNDQELVRTYLHEMGHMMSGAGDATTAFEAALDGIAGKLAMKILGGWR